MDLDFKYTNDGENNCLVCALTVKNVEKQNWKDMLNSEFEEMFNHPKMSMSTMFRKLMELYCTQLLEVQSLREQLVEKTILVDPITPTTEKTSNFSKYWIFSARLPTVE